MNTGNIKESELKEIFSIEIVVDKPIVVGQDDIVGRRQLIPILSGKVIGDGFNGEVLPGGIDSQIIRPDGKCDLSARYAIKLEDGASIYIENNGVRTVPIEYVEDVKSGKFVDPSVYYFRTIPTFETYDDGYKWMMDCIFVCYATRLPENVLLKFYKVM
ncbi:DUF3237 domain-containing protein [Clostridium fungisolvens]|uniref:UPF0311 protein bsdtw1_03323 n=1 Tax=Clostridium fungisolvens TaxID=1604897 RepID=A0A6V8SJ06_9CLOT|nr:DUF3237 domain-containing protein [Clostridium fungisolvens]GFP77209.1 hypothetical protein bsdtw1_03323 [Clostridium fungisolvens]